MKTLILIVSIMAFIFASAGQTMADDWLKADGYGIAPETVTNPARKRLYARQAAQLEAEKELCKKVWGYYVDSDATIVNLELKESDVIQTVQGFLYNTTLLDESFLPDGSYKITAGIKKEQLKHVFELLEKKGDFYR